MAATSWPFPKPSPSSLVWVFQNVTDPSDEPHAMWSPVVETAISVISDRSGEGMGEPAGLDVPHGYGVGMRKKQSESSGEPWIFVTVSGMCRDC
jgi:hypothetical protein